MKPPKIIFTGTEADDLSKQWEDLTSMSEAMSDNIKDMGKYVDKIDYTHISSEANSLLQRIKQISKNTQTLLTLNESQLQNIGLTKIEAEKLYNIAKRKVPLTEMESDLMVDILENVQTRLDIQEELLNKVKEEKAEFEAYVKEYSLFAKLGEYVKNTAKEIKWILSDPKLAAGIFTAAVVAQAKTLVESADKLRTTFGLNGTQTLEMGKNLTVAAFQGAFLGLSFEKTQAATEAITKNNANLSKSTSTQIKQVAYMADRYGMSADSAAKLLQTTQQLSNYNKANANELIKSYGAIANAYNVARSAVMEDMAQNAEFLALHTKNGATNIATASAAMQSLGMNLNDVNSISSKLLDIEGSINAEMQASVFLGKNLNLARARELAFAGDYDKLLTEIGDQLPTINQWENLNLVQRQKVAEAYGLSADKLFQMIGEHENINKLSNNEEGFWGSIYMHISSAVKGVMAYKELVGSSLNLVASMLTNWQGIVKAGSWMKDKIGGVFSKQEVVDQTQSIGETIIDKGKEKITDTLTDKVSDKVSDKVDDLTNSVSSSGKMMSNILKGAAALAIISVALIGIAAALKIAEDVKWDTVGIMSTMLVVLTGAVVLLGKTMSAAGSGILYGAGALVILGAALIPLAYALNLMAPGLEVMKGLADPAIIGGLFLASGAIISLASSISLLSISLLTLLPMLPVLAAVKAFGLSDINASLSTSSNKNDNNDLKEIKSLLSDIKTSIDKGHNIYLDERKIGSSLDKYSSQQYALNPI